MDKKPEEDKKDLKQKKKQDYKSPELIDYGLLDDLTLTGGSGFADLLGEQDMMAMN